MRKIFLQTSSYRNAKKQAPWAAIIAKVSGGFYAFESVADYKTFKNQQ